MGSLHLVFTGHVFDVSLFVFFTPYGIQLVDLHRDFTQLDQIQCFPYLEERGGGGGGGCVQEGREG